MQVDIPEGVRRNSWCVIQRCWAISSCKVECRGATKGCYGSIRRCRTLSNRVQSWLHLQTFPLRLQRHLSYVFSNFYSNFWLIFGKLCEARSRLYRSRILQVNTRLKALDEIYKIYTLLHRSAFKISAKFRQTFSRFHSFIFKMSLMFPKSWHLSCLKFTN